MGWGTTRGIAGTLVAALWATGCVPSLSVLQRAETEAPGHGELQASVGAYLVGQTRTDQNGQTTHALAPAPNVELAGRLGLAPRLDVGLKAYSDGPGLVADLKIEALRTDRVVVSVDPGAGLATPGTVTAGGTQQKAGAFHLYLPVIVGIHLGPDELVLSPRIIGWLVSFGQSSSVAWLVGGGAGFDFPAGPVHLMPELDLACGVAGKVPCFGYLAFGLNYD